MKLSQLVHYRNQLQELSQRDPMSAIKDNLGPVLYEVQNNDIRLPDQEQKLQADYDRILSDINEFAKTTATIIDNINSLISNLQPKYFADSYRLYDQEMRHDKAEYVLDRRFSFNAEAQEYIKARVSLYTDWHYPGMIIRPGREDWIDSMVALDPLYVIDQTHDLMEPVRNKFGPEYQRRLRYYTVDEDASPHVLAKVPNGQFGFVLAYNFFNFKPFEVIRHYLTDIYQKLRPGGTLALTFNDCDRTAGVKLAEQNFMCYTPGTMLESLIRSIGYEITQTYHVDAACSWLEVRKPGELKSLRGGQTLAKIIAKSK